MFSAVELTRTPGAKMETYASGTSKAAPSVPETTSATESIIMVVSGLAVLAALILGVGIPNHMVLRHIVQTLPAWGVVIFGVRRSRVTGWIALPVFVFWLVLMSLIWLYLLGLVHLLSGTFTAWEISMTVVVAVMCVVGIGTSVRFRSSLSSVGKAALFVGVALLQFLCLRISFLPAIAHR
jgi:hypothetical protein